MSCTKPLYAVDFGVYDGKHHLKILGSNPKYIDGVLSDTKERYSNCEVLSLPCGSCSSCRKAKAHDWAVRCMCEASCWKNNWFVTLTYDDEHNPIVLVKKDLQKFIKTVRNKFGKGIRYFACGEYGGRTKRPHFHLILFNLDLEDVRHLCSGPHGGNYLQSKALAECWPNGHITIGEVSYSSACYTAEYCLKKSNQESFILMSNRPGIGGYYAMNKLDLIYDTDNLELPGKKSVKPPRYFDKLLARVDESKLEDIKKVRISNANDRLIDDLLFNNCSSFEQKLKHDDFTSSVDSRKKVRRTV